MSRFNQIAPEAATGKTKDLPGAVKSKLGLVHHIVSLAACLYCLSAATAGMSLRNDPPQPRKSIISKYDKDVAPDAPEPPPKSEKQQFVITDATQVLLDGQACKLKDIPATAEVVNIELAVDKKTVLKLHFHSK
jgi:hypothetical protein